MTLTSERNLITNPVFIVFLLLTGYWILALFDVINPGTMEIDKASAIYFTSLAILGLMYLSVAGMRYASPQVVWEDGHDSCTGTWIPAGNYAIIRGGGIRAFEMELEGELTKETLIVPIDCITKRGKNIVISAYLEEETLERLPPEVKKKIIELNVKPPYLLGYISEEQLKSRYDTRDIEDITGLRQIEGTQIVELVKQKDRFANSLLELLDDISSGKMKSIEDIVAAAKRIHSVAAPENMFSRIKDLVVRRREEEEI